MRRAEGLRPAGQGRRPRGKRSPPIATLKGGKPSCVPIVPPPHPPICTACARFAPVRLRSPLIPFDSVRFCSIPFDSQAFDLAGNGQFASVDLGGTFAVDRDTGTTWFAREVPSCGARHGATAPRGAPPRHEGLRGVEGSFSAGVTHNAVFVSRKGKRNVDRALLRFYSVCADARAHRS